MADRLILETTFLVDLHREGWGSAEGPATRFLEEHATFGLCVTRITAGEMASGLGPHDRDRWERSLRGFALLDVDSDVCWIYGRIFSHLRKNGLLIGTNDLWIAATAVVHGLPLVTRNDSHFVRVPELDVISY